MIFPLILIFSILPFINAQDTDTGYEYDFIDSPILWIHAGLLIWGLISALILVTKLGEFCLLDSLTKRGKPLGCLSFLVTAFFVNSCVDNLSNMPLF